MSRAPQPQLREPLAAQVGGLRDLSLTLVAAPGGYGKTTLARRWQEGLQADGVPTAWLTLSALHDDLTLLLEDLIDAMRAALPARDEHEVAFGETIERSISSGTGLQPDRLARTVGRECRALAAKPVLFLDAIEHLPNDSAGLAFVDALLRLDPCPLSLVLTTRGSRPDSMATHLAAGSAALVDQDALSLRTSQLEAILDEAGVEPEPELVAILLARTGGWAMAVRLMVRALATLPPTERLSFLRESGGQSELFEYVAKELLGRVSNDVVSLVETSALLGAAPRALLVGASGVSDATARIDEALDAGLLSTGGDRLMVHDLWTQWLVDRMQARRDGGDWRSTKARVGLALEADGQSERALDHYVEALEEDGIEDRVVRILSEEADRWVSLGHRRSVEVALEALPADRRQTTPALIALDGLLLSGRDPDRAITHLKKAATAYQDAGNARAEFMCLHELAIVAVNENRLAEVWAVYRRALSARRMVKDPGLRALVVMALGHGAMIAGRYGVSRRFHDVALTYDHDPRERGGIAIVQSAIRLQSGEWDEAVQAIETLLEIPEQRQHGLTFHALRVFHAAINVTRGQDLERARLWLDEAIETYQATQHTMSLIRAYYVLGYHAQIQKDDDTARRSYEQASALATRSEFWEALAASEGCLARLHQRRDETEEARAAAGRALSALEADEAWSIRRGRLLSWSSGIALACAVLADTGESQRAAAFLDKYLTRIAQPDLPLCQHAVLCLTARVEQRNDRLANAEKALREAWKVAEKAGLADFSPELDAELLEWAAREAKALGATGPCLEACLTRFGTASPAPVTLHTFGGLAFERNGKRLRDRDWRGATQRRLFMRLLVSEGQALTRERIETDLWPDVPSRRAANNLRVAISHLKNALEPRRLRKPGGELLEVDAGRVTLSEALSAGWDVTKAWRALEDAKQKTETGDEAGALAAAREFAAVARGAFLPECYDEWVLDYGRALDRSFVEEARELAAAWREKGSSKAAQSFAEIALARDGADEQSWEILIGTLRDANDRSGALRAYQEACRNLARELDAEPGPTLQGLVADL